MRPRLRKIPGVAEVFLQGGERKQYQILVEPAALLKYGVSLEDVEQAVASQPEGESERPIRILGRLGPDAQRVIEDLKRVPVKASDVRPVLLEQVELGTLAETGAGLGPSSVNRENARRRIVIRCNTQGQDASRLAAMMEPITPSLEPQSNNQNRHDQLARLSPLADQERAGRLFNP